MYRHRRGVYRRYYRRPVRSYGARRRFGGYRRRRY